MPGALEDLETRLWNAADQLRANSGLRSSEYSTPVLGLIFLRFADVKFQHADEQLQAQQRPGSRHQIGPTDYQARGVMYLPEAARYSHLMRLPESADIGTALNEAMRAIEEENPDLRGVLPQNYTQPGLARDVLWTLMRLFAQIPLDIEGDIFGKIYEYFLGEFARNEGSKGGEFFTPTAIVKLIVAILEPFHGRIFDPACGSGGMFVQSARFVQNHRHDPNAKISIYGQEKTRETVRLCKMNLAVHGLSGD